MRLIIVFILIILAIFLTLYCCKEKKNYNQKSDSIDLTIINEFKDDLIKKYNKYRLIHKKEEAIVLTIKWLKTNDIVDNSNVSIDNDTIWIIFINGVEIDIVVH